MEKDDIEEIIEVRKKFIVESLKKGTYSTFVINELKRELDSLEKTIKEKKDK